jgi:hypothetical protein
VAALGRRPNVSVRYVTDPDADDVYPGASLQGRPTRPNCGTRAAMDELIARLESLLGRYAATLDQDEADRGQPWEQFRRELRLLIAEYGPAAVDAALNAMPDGAGATISLQ